MGPKQKRSKDISDVIRSIMIWMREHARILAVGIGLPAIVLVGHSLRHAGCPFTLLPVVAFLLGGLMRAVWTQCTDSQSSRPTKMHRCKCGCSCSSAADCPYSADFWE